MVPLVFFFGIMGSAIGGVLLKLGATKIGQPEISSLEQLFDFLIKLFTSYQVLIGIFLYFLSAVAWAYLLTKLDLSFVQPILALTYVVTPILAIFIIGENVSLMRWLGILVIVVGVFIVARTAT